MQVERRSPLVLPVEVEKPTSGPRSRERVERGIVKRWKASGEAVFEYAFFDSDGRVKRGTTKTLREARLLRGEKAAKASKGEVAQPKRATFAEFAEQWFEGKKSRLRGRTAAYYRRSLDLVLLPRFGRHQLRAIDVDAIVKLTRDLEREGLHAIDPSRASRPLGTSSVNNYLRPLQGIMKLAARRQLIPLDPFALLVADDRPAKAEPAAPHEWTTDEVAALLAASAAMAAKPESRHDYTPLLRVTVTLGLRLSEVLGPTWADFDRNADDGAGVLHVRRQWLPSREYGPPKTRAGARRIPLPD